MKINHDARMLEIIRALPEGEKPRLLLHSCCGPCSGSVLEKLCGAFEVTLFYYNPNIAPYEEYVKRAGEQQRLLDELPFRVPMILGEWDSEAYYEAVRGLENAPEGGERCLKCFRLRLDATARAAAAGHFDYFTTTLTVSPHKNADNVNREGEAAGEAHHVRYLPSDFKKRDGYLRSLEISREHSLYRQDYCGCVYSMRPDRKENGGTDNGHTA